MLDVIIPVVCELLIVTAGILAIAVPSCRCLPMSAPDREPVGQAVNSMLLYLEQIACMTLMPETFAEVAAEEENLKDAVVGLELILRIIKARKPKLRVVK